MDRAEAEEEEEDRLAAVAQAHEEEAAAAEAAVRDVEALKHGGAVPLDPIKPVLIAPGTKRLKLYYDEPLSNFDLDFNLRRYSMGTAAAASISMMRRNMNRHQPMGKARRAVCAWRTWDAGPYTPSLFTSIAIAWTREGQ